jgi:hypothetical protein
LTFSSNCIIILSLQKPCASAQKVGNFPY